MTTRHAGYLVVLEKNIREDDAEDTLTALRAIRGVLSVQPVEASIDQQLGQIRADGEWREKLLGLLSP